MTCEACRESDRRMVARESAQDADACIRDMVEWSGCDAARALAGEARNMEWMANHLEGHPRSCCRSRAPRARRAARRYAIAAWAMARIAAGRDEHQRAVKAWEGLDQHGDHRQLALQVR